MKKILLIALISTSVFTLEAQVGINVAFPTKMLDVNGEARVRVLPDQDPGSSSMVSVDNDGNLGKSSAFLPSDVGSVVATTNVNYTSPSSGGIVNNLDLGLSTTAVIPANRNAFVIISYSVPVGMAVQSNPNAFYGIRFLKDGTEVPAGSRKFSVVNNSNANMVTVSNLYTENFSSSPVERTVTYELNGYVEQAASGSSHVYRFNMWSPTGPNYNWGRAVLVKQVFIQ